MKKVSGSSPAFLEVCCMCTQAKRALTTLPVQRYVSRKKGGLYSYFAGPPNAQNNRVFRAYRYSAEQITTFRGTGAGL
jgi:hypothetical protein